MRYSWMVVSLFQIVIFFNVGCSDDKDSDSTNLVDKKLTVSAKAFTENIILGKLFKLTAEKLGYTVTDRTNSGYSSQENRDALINGNIDVYAEYTGTALTNYLGYKQLDDNGKIITDNIKVLTDPQTNIQTATSEDQKKNNIVWGTPAQFNNTYALAVEIEFAQANNLQTIDDLAKYTSANPPKIKWVVNHEFYRRPDGIAGLQNLYAFTLPENSPSLELLDKSTVYDFYTANKDTSAAAGVHYAVMVFGTDSQVAEYKLRVMDDNKDFWPYYAPAPIFRKDYADKHQALIAAVNKIAPLLTADEMRELNRQVDFGKAQHEAVAKQWLSKKGL
jgi:osmoprotectant transport system substrate-binding protein